MTGFRGLLIFLTGLFLVLLLPACKSAAEPSGAEEPASPRQGDGTTAEDLEPASDGVRVAVAEELASACEDGQEAQVFPLNNVMEYAGEWKTYNVACVANGESAKTVRVWAPDSVVDDPGLIAAEGQPLSRELLRQIVDQDNVKLRPVAEMVISIVLPDKAKGGVYEDPMSDLDTPDQDWVGKFHHPRVVVADGTGDRLLEFDVERLKIPDYATVRVTLDGEGPVEVVDMTPIEPNK